MKCDLNASFAPTSSSENGIQWFVPVLHEMRFCPWKSANARQSSWNSASAFHESAGHRNWSRSLSQSGAMQSLTANAVQIHRMLFFVISWIRICLKSFADGWDVIKVPIWFWKSDAVVLK